jgi:hypothetical protein
MTPRHPIRTTILILAALAVALPVSAAPITTLYNTGVDGVGAVLSNGVVDPHYTLVSVPSGSTVVRVITADGYPIPPYIGDNTVSRWVGPNNSSDLVSAPGNYVYRTTFSLAGFQASTAVITGQWTSDNDGVQVLLNGVDTGIPATGFSQFSVGFVPFAISSGFQPGVNTLDFVIHNGGSAPGNSTGGANPTSLRVEMTGTAVVPDGGSALVLLGASMALLEALRRRR